MTNFARIAYYLVAGLRRLHWSKSRLKEYQDRRVRAIVRHAYDFVPFYHDRFKRCGISPCDVKTVEDLNKLPILRKEDLRNVDVSNLISREHSLARLKGYQTSGSSGKPFRVFLSNIEGEWRKAIYLRANVSCGQRPRDCWAFVTAPHHFGDTTNIQRRIGVFAQTLIPLFAQPSRQLQFLRSVDPDILDGYSGAILLMAKEAKRSGANDVHPRVVFGSSDSIDLPSRKFIESVFVSKYLDQYGCAEVNRMAWQCPEQRGYHLDVDSVVTQFIDASDMEVSEGEKGEIVITSLYNFAMPLIRYHLGDVGEPSQETCSCWRTFPLMKSVQGRKDSFVNLPDGRLISPYALSVGLRFFRFFDSIDQFRIIQKRRDFFVVYLKMNCEVANKELLVKELSAYLTSLLEAEDLGLVFDIKLVDNIPLSKTGRLGAVFSEVS
jgi:phenylacetate-CoA ligase